jgi:hypothetical protein
MGAGSFKSGNSNYHAPGHKASTIRPAKMDDGDSTGVGSGLSALSGFDSENPLNPDIDYAVDPVSGNSTERVSLRSKSVKSKGESMEMC